MELTKAERLILLNQCKILKNLFPDDEEENEHLDQCIKILRNGYEHLYYLLDMSVDSCYLSEEDSQLIVSILGMFEDIEVYKEAHPDDREINNHLNGKFFGFDAHGTKETNYISFTEFLINDLGRYPLLASDKGFNSHGSFLQRYINMVAVWNQNKHDLSRETILEILNAG